MSTDPRLKNSLYCEGSMLCALLTPKALIACTCWPETRPRKENKPVDYRESSFSQLEFKVRLYYSVLPALTIRVQSCAILNLRIQEHDGHQHAMHAGIVNRKKMAATLRSAFTSVTESMFPMSRNLHNQPRHHLINTGNKIVLSLFWYIVNNNMFS